MVQHRRYRHSKFDQRGRVGTPIRRSRNDTPRLGSNLDRKECIQKRRNIVHRLEEISLSAKIMLYSTKFGNFILSHVPQL